MHQKPFVGRVSPDPLGTSHRPPPRFPNWISGMGALGKGRETKKKEEKGSEGRGGERKVVKGKRMRGWKGIQFRIALFSFSSLGYSA